MSPTQRILIIGNSGSGKTWLGKALSKKMHIPLYHMDSLRWDQSGYEVSRSAAQINKDLEEIKKQDQWILEGVFGKMAQACLPFSTTLIWLDLPWEECKQNLINRGPQFEECQASFDKDKALEKLIAWAAQHDSRQDYNSSQFFESLYTTYPHVKFCLHNRNEVMDFLIH